MIERYVGVVAVFVLLALYVLVTNDSILSDHERVHSTLDGRYGLNSSTTYTYLLWGVGRVHGLTVVNDSSLSSEQQHELFLQQGYVEVVGYNTMTICSVMMFSTVILVLCFFLIRHDIYLMRGEKR